MSGKKEKAPDQAAEPEADVAAAVTVPLVAISPIEHDGARYGVGATFGVAEPIAARLIELGAAERAVAA